ncbi:MAG TPA: hypothetical protein VET23_04975 [Chitinophagaceae bacterium]|nr:hypothetical protein [Chitinophagaceae bacterium]
MKRRALRITNFIAFNLLFFALYLNFIHKDKSVVPVQNVQTSTAFSGTVPVENPEKYLDKKNNIPGSQATLEPNGDKPGSATVNVSTN